MYVDAGRPVDLHVCVADGDCSVSLVTTARMGGAADFKVGTNRIRERSEPKKCTPTFANIYQRINEEEAGK